MTSHQRQCYLSNCNSEGYVVNYTKMLRSDARIRSVRLDSLPEIVSSITVNVIAQIEKELDAYDLVSLVFLLYDVPDTALQRLIVHQRVALDGGEKNLNLLYDWAQHAQTRPTWKYEFLEALVICQLLSILKKLGLNPHSIQKHYLPDNIHVTAHINPMKKALYKLSENITKSNLDKLQKTLKTYEFDTTEYKTCELVFLELMCKKFITIDNVNYGKNSAKCQIEALAKIIHNFPGLQKFANELREIQDRINNEPKSNKPETSTSPVKFDSTSSEIEFGDSEEVNLTVAAFNDLFNYLDNVNIKDDSIQKSDTNRLDGVYAIKNPKRVGVCYIINQEDFHPSKESIQNSIQSEPLEKRYGSNMDKLVLEKTMESLNFEVISHRNLDHVKMLDYIQNIIQYRVHPDDSMFMLCILSHGVRGHVYAANSVKVNIDDIQRLLDEGLQQRQLEIPKIMILEACQVNNDEEPRLKLVADGPSGYYLKKLNFLVYWATAPELEAYRDTEKGSIFIQILCHLIKKHAKHEHLYDIFTKVTDGVAKICSKLERDQVPIFKSTLRKKLYLQIPEKSNIN
uniref:Caspase family p20 domain-containing protein n=1 Tax=Pectinophora gossypiella TaxID=13191 RepID=A0A1E1WQP3_PECGO